MRPVDDDLAQASAYAEAALAELQAAGVPATPANFEIWYTYVSQRDAELVRAMDALTADGEAFTPERLGNIQKLYFGRDDADAARLTEISEHMAATLSSVMAQLDGAGREVTAFGGRVESLSERADAAPAQFQKIVQALMREATEMAAHSRAVSNTLGQSRHMVATLHDNLSEMRQAADTDALTGLANRRVMERALADAAAAAMETGGELCVAMSDIDHFKTFNDTRGYLLGDEALRVVARLLRQETRARDLVARYGGEEFAIVMPETSLESARRVAERIRDQLASRNLSYRKSGEVVGRITLSIGLACYRHGEPLEALMQRADDSLYAAKRGGRNRVVVARRAEALAVAERV